MDAMQDNTGATESQTRPVMDAVGQTTPVRTTNTTNTTTNITNKSPEGLQQDTKSLQLNDIPSDSNTPGEGVDQTTGKRRVIRWTELEEQKLVEILNNLRDAETRRTGSAPLLSNKSIFIPAAIAMGEYFSTPRSNKGCFSYWVRNRDRDSEIYAFLPIASRKSRGTTSQSKKRPSAAGLNQDIEADEDDEEEGDEGETRTPDTTKRPKSQSKKKAEDGNTGESSRKRNSVVRFEPEEMKVLREEAIQNPYPDAIRKQELAAELKLDVKRIVRFFGNVQCGNYAWGRHLKKAVQVEEGSESSMLGSPPSSAGAETPSRQSSDAVSETGKGKRRHTLTAKALEAEQGRKRRYSRSPYTKDVPINDNDSPPSQSQTHQLSVSKATIGEATSTTNLNSRIKQSHHPSPLAFQASHADEMEADLDEEQAGRSNSTTPERAHSERSKSSSFTTPFYPFVHPAPVTAIPKGPPVMIKRVAPAYDASQLRVPFDEEQAKLHAASISRQVRSEMTAEQLYRADHPPASPYDMGPVPKVEYPVTHDETALDKRALLLRKWEASKTKLEKDIEREVEARKKLIKSTLLVKSHYNAGNDKLSGFSKEYTDPDTPLERKKELSDEFNVTQKWMTLEKNRYNSMRDQSEAAKRRIEAKNMELSQLKMRKVEVDPVDSN